MEDDDIRRLLHSAYRVDGVDPTVVHGALEQQPRGPRHRRLLTPIVAAVVAIVVAVPVGAAVLLRTGVIGGVPASTMSVLDLKMFGASDGWAWSGGTNILHTNAGVQHWDVVPPPIEPKSIVEVAWVDAESARILATAAGTLNDVEKTYRLTTWMTDDGGATWREGQPFSVLLETGQDPTSNSDLQFVDRMHGWFFDNQDGTFGGPLLILRTIDGGVHWSTVSTTPAKGPAPTGALPATCAKYGMAFLNATTGWVAGGCISAPPLFYVTQDGGASWSPQAINCGANCYLDAPRFTSALDGYMTGQLGVELLFVTADGGRTWQARPNPPATSLDFLDAAHGFSLGLNGNDNPAAILWRTANGGSTWTEAPNGAIQGDGPVETSQVDFITPTMGWAVSIPIYMEPVPHPIPQQLWQTADAGSTWTLITPTFTAAK